MTAAKGGFRGGQTAKARPGHRVQSLPDAGTWPPCQFALDLLAFSYEASPCSIFRSYLGYPKLEETLHVLVRTSCANNRIEPPKAAV